MKIKIINVSIIACLLFLLNCKNYDHDVSAIKSKLESIDHKLNTTPKDDFLDFLRKSEAKEGYNEEFEKFFEEKKIYFTLNLRNKKPQVIHLSSDEDKIPFMVLCKVNGVEKGDKFHLKSVKLAIRSIGKKPHTFFKIKGMPRFESVENENYQWKLSAFIDINNTSVNEDEGNVDIGSKEKIINSGDLIDVHINPEMLIASLNKLYDSNPELKNQFGKLNIDELITMLCCGGVICNTQPTVPKP